MRCIADLSENPIQLIGVPVRIPLDDIPDVYPLHLIPWRATFVREADLVKSQFGEEQISGDEFVVFEALDKNLPDIDNPEVQRDIVKAFVMKIHSEILKDKPTSDPHEMILIMPYHFPHTLIDIFRTIINRQDYGLELKGIFSEQICQIAYTIKNMPVMNQKDSTEKRVIIINLRSHSDGRILKLIWRERSDESHIEIVDNSQISLNSKEDIEVLISELRIHEMNSVIFIFGSDINKGTQFENIAKGKMASSQYSKSKVKKAFMVQNLQKKPENAQTVKFIGALQLLKFMEGKEEPNKRFYIQNRFNIGVHSGQERFHTLVPREEVSITNRFPSDYFGVFRLKETLSQNVRFTLCCGYSERTCDSIPLGYLNSNGKTHGKDEIYELVVSVHMDSIAQGKATLYYVNPNEKTLLEVDGTRFRMNPLLY
ncbi:MAG: hypothetical protein SVY10_18260 [Thermodesulfobacteriota bacterium]|nr:hypothetical protein [Thermodesulfobacteriota bacterium]